MHRASSAAVNLCRMIIAAPHEGHCQSEFSQAAGVVFVPAVVESGVSSWRHSVYAVIRTFYVFRNPLKKRICQKFAKNPGKPIQTHARCSAPSLPPAPKGRR